MVQFVINFGWDEFKRLLAVVKVCGESRSCAFHMRFRKSKTDGR